MQRARDERHTRDAEADSDNKDVEDRGTDTVQLDDSASNAPSANALAVAGKANRTTD